METAATTKVEVLDRLHHLGPELGALGVARLGLFGSFLSGDVSDASDVDILVEFVPGRKTFDNFMTLAQRLEDVLQRPVELITREWLSPHIGPRILEMVEYVSVGG
ncbi:MAG TPA: nucleotidyltransferase family protein [Rhodothermia bacterium]